MAANLQNHRLSIFGKRIARQLSGKKAVHASVYDKDPDEHDCPVVVPDSVIPPRPDGYWSPHPETGVFGPASDHKHTSGGQKTKAGSTLDERVFFRSLEDLDKPVEP